MILNSQELQEYVEAEHYADTFVPLHVDEIIEFRGNIQVTETDYSVRLQKELEPHRGEEYRLSAGPYHVHFAESVEFPAHVVPFILPSSNALRAGCVAAHRYVTDDELWTGLNVQKGCAIDVDAVLGILIAFDTSNQESEVTTPPFRAQTEGRGAGGNEQDREEQEE